MLRSQRIRGFAGAIRRSGLIGAGLICALASAGCSADLNRFSYPTSAGYSADGVGAPVPSQPVRRNAGIPVDQGADYGRPGGRYDAAPGGYAPPVRDYNYGGGGYGDQRGGYGAAPYAGGPQPQGGGSYPSDAPRQDYRGGYAPQSSAGSPTPGWNVSPRGQDLTTRGTSDTRMASLPPGSQPDAGARSTEAQRPAYTPASSSADAAAGAKSANTIEVQPGDTLTSISKHYRVSASELMSLNNLRSPILRPGQTLVLPRGRRALADRQVPARQEQAQAQTTMPAPATAHAQETALPASGPARSGTDGTHVVANGESLYGIARKYNVKVADLQSANGIADITKIKPGMALTIPGGAGKAPSAPMSFASNERAAPVQHAEPSRGPSSVGTLTPITVKPRIINAETPPEREPQRMAALQPSTPTASDATAEPAGRTASAEPSGGLPEPPKLAATGKFRWPVKGKVIAHFGSRSDKSHNDGINISVPLGTEVMAAENGVVAYAGNELKGYGNLVLIRHDGNWVSAYAHNDELLVHRGDKVRRGQSIAKAGNTGSVDQPQVHFELRQGSKPVDPMPHMEKQ
jgi:murein DD-endopeptidase MepM/ murein hydrolase activator NlpD